MFVVPAFEFRIPSPCYDEQKSAHHSEMMLLVYKPTLNQTGPLGLPPPKSSRCIPYPRTKLALVKALNQGWITPFHSYTPGHLATNNTRWINSTKPYYVIWSTGYEPYVIVNKTNSLTPRYDERFVDRGLNKVVFSALAHCRQFRLVVLHNVFTVHYYESRQLTKAFRKQTMHTRKDIYYPLLAEENLRYAKRKRCKPTERSERCPGIDPRYGKNFGFTI
jgi:hypothetical protein